MAFPSHRPQAYRRQVVTVVRVARVVLIVVLALMAISFVISIGTSNTGLLEKALLLALVGVCIYAAAKVTTLSERIVHRLDRQ